MLVPTRCGPDNQDRFRLSSATPATAVVQNKMTSPLLYLSSSLNMADPNVKMACIPSVSSSTLSAGEWPPVNVDVSF